MLGYSMNIHVSALFWFIVKLKSICKVLLYETAYSLRYMAPQILGAKTSNHHFHYCFLPLEFWKFHKASLCTSDISVMLYSLAIHQMILLSI